MGLHMFFFFNDTATTEIYTLSLHDALPIFRAHHREVDALLPKFAHGAIRRLRVDIEAEHQDRKSTRLNSSHLVISYAVFCLKKKKNIYVIPISTDIHRHTVKSIVALESHSA